MKKLIAPIAALALALTPGCMTSRAVVKSINTSMAPIIDALARDTNSCHLRIVATVFTLEFDRNVGGYNQPPSSAGFSVTPTTTLQVRPTP